MVRSKMSSVDIPEVSLPQVIFQMMEMYSDRIALVDGITEKSYTYAETLSNIRRIASGLTRRGLRKGDILAMNSTNSPEFVFMFFGTLACGATVTTINPVYTVYEVKKHFEDARPGFVFASTENAKIVMEAGKQLGLNQNFITSGPYPNCTSVEDLLQDDGSRYPEDVVINPKEDVAVIPYSSGTTGFPKGVMITHYNIVAQLMMLGHPDMQAEGTSTEGQIVTLGFVPFYHVYGLVGLLIGSNLRGAKLISMPRFIPERVLQLIEKYKVTNLPVVPPVVIFLTKSPLAKKYDLSSIESVTSGAAPLSKDTEQEFLNIVNIPELRQGYGMTEVTLAASYPPPNLPIKAGSCGVPLANIEMQVVDIDTHKVLGPGDTGEIWVKGPNTMKGYLNRPEATRDTLDKDGWIHTGDVGYHDEDGYFYIVERIKELIKYKGFQVAPAELEALLLNHPQIDDVAVIGVPDKEAGELPKAYVVRKPGFQLTENDVKQYVADHVSSFKHLKGGVEFIATVPKSQSGKILRRELRDKLKQSKL